MQLRTTKMHFWSKPSKSFSGFLYKCDHHFLRSNDGQTSKLGRDHDANAVIISPSRQSTFCHNSSLPPRHYIHILHNSPFIHHVFATKIPHHHGYASHGQKGEYSISCRLCGKFRSWHHHLISVVALLLHCFLLLLFPTETQRTSDQSLCTHF